LERIRHERGFKNKIPLLVRGGRKLTELDYQNTSERSASVWGDFGGALFGNKVAT